ncbi:MAG TPA: hypothetical protein VFV37_06540 [Luteibaculaceae bacterium]|nr:hypothetical protein [Luteibaculaceae bacterium]
MVKWICFSLLALVQFNSICAQVPSRIQKFFTQCYDSNHLTKGSFPRFDGYYTVCIHPKEIEEIGPQGEKYVTKKDSSFFNITFFPDGVCLFSDATVERVEYYVPHLKTLQNAEKVTHDYFYQFENWGLFWMDGDTLKTQRTNHEQRFSAYWNFYENHFLIKDELVWEKIRYRRNSETFIVLKNNAADQHIEFTRTGLYLKSDTWLKKEKWFWCDPKEWEKWMKEKGYRY